MRDSAGMKVAALSGISRTAGGLFYAVSSLCKALDRLGAQTSVYGRSAPYVEDDRPVWDPVPVIPYNSWGPLGSSLRLRRMLLEADPDLTHQHGLWMDDQWAALHWHNKTGKPMVISPHGMLDPWALRNSAWKKKLAGRLFADTSLSKATCLHALCDSEADSIRRLGLNNPVAVIPNGVDLPEFTDQREERQRKRLLFLGRLHPKKGLFELLRGWAKVQRLKLEGVSNWQLLIAGWDDGNHLARLKQLASQLDLSWSDEVPPSDLQSDLCSPISDLCFLGPKFGEEKEVLLRSVDAFILPSFSEGLPMSVLEAWSYGLPVMMTEFCNIPEGFNAGAALKIRPDTESIAGGIGQWIEMGAAERKNMGERGRLLVEKRFTWNKIARDMKSVYEDCVAGKGSPS